MENKSKEITELKAKQKTFEDDYTALQEENNITQKNLREARQKVQDLENTTRILGHKIVRATKGQGITTLQLRALEEQQQLYERHKQVEILKEEHPTFLDLIGTYLKELEIEQEQGKKLPLELAVNADVFRDKIEEIDTQNFIRTHGLGGVSLTFRNFQEQYEARITRLIEGHLDGNNQFYSFEDLELIAKRFIQEPNVKEYLGR